MPEELRQVESHEDLIAQIDSARASLYSLLRARSPDELARRPPTGEWSVVENVRHLLYAEQLHLGRPLLPRGFVWSTIGLPPGGRARRSGAGTQVTNDIEEVLAAWDAVHEPIRDAARSAEAPSAALERNLRHLRAHIRTVEALLGGRRA